MIYENSPNIESLSIPERVQAFKKTALWMLQQKGVSVSHMKDVVNYCIHNERYEASEGVRLAIEEFEKNPQLSLL